jgi:hypothetical protein
MPTPNLILGARRLAQDAEIMLKIHEDDAHGGERCQLERCNLVAFLAHRLGVRDERSLLLVREALAEHEEAHLEHDRTDLKPERTGERP